MTSNTHTAIVTVTFQVEFEDDGELAIMDQAHEAAIARFNENEIWDSKVDEIHELAVIA